MVGTPPLTGPQLHLDSPTAPFRRRPDTEQPQLDTGIVPSPELGSPNAAGSLAAATAATAAGGTAYPGIVIHTLLVTWDVRTSRLQIDTAELKAAGIAYEGLTGEMCVG